MSNMRLDAPKRHALHANAQRLGLYAARDDELKVSSDDTGGRNAKISWLVH